MNFHNALCRTHSFILNRHVRVVYFQDGHASVILDVMMSPLNNPQQYDDLMFRAQFQLGVVVMVAF